MKSLRLGLVLAGILCTVAVVPATAQGAVSPLHCANVYGLGFASAFWYNQGTQSNPGTGLLSELSFEGSISGVTWTQWGNVDPQTGWMPIACVDTLGFGNADIIWQRTNSSTGRTELGLWLATGEEGECIFTAPNVYHPAAFADMNNDTRSDIIWQGPGTGGDPSKYFVWYMDGCTLLGTAWLPNSYGNFQLIGTGDFNGDGKADLLWYNSATNQIAIWLMDNTTILDSAIFDIPATDPPGYAWQIPVIADFDGDGKSDLLWVVPQLGKAAIWFMNGTSIKSTAVLPGLPPTSSNTLWFAVGSDDYWRFPGVTQVIMWYSFVVDEGSGTQGPIALWYMNGSTVLASEIVPFPPSDFPQSFWYPIAGLANVGSGWMGPSNWVSQGSSE